MNTFYVILILFSTSQRRSDVDGDVTGTICDEVEVPLKFALHLSNINPSWKPNYYFLLVVVNYYYYYYYYYYHHYYLKLFATETSFSEFNEYVRACRQISISKSNTKRDKINVNKKHNDLFYENA